MPITSFGQEQSNPPASGTPDNSAQTTQDKDSSSQTTTDKDSSSPASADNSSQNKAQSNTAEQQPENATDRMTTKKVRQTLMADKSLSMSAHNVKVITQNGVVTLKGPVNSEEEKQSIGSKAAEVAGSPDKVANELTVKSNDN
jgi:hyperosmotically inducible periplasmic protein